MLAFVVNKSKSGVVTKRQINIGSLRGGFTLMNSGVNPGGEVIILAKETSIKKVRNIILHNLTDQLEPTKRIVSATVIIGNFVPVINNNVCYNFSCVTASISPVKKIIKLSERLRRSQQSKIDRAKV